MAPAFQELRPRRVRSRSGCLSCRRRRKKCDEQKPVCVACQRNKLVCSWPEIEVEAVDSENNSETSRPAMVPVAPFNVNGDSDDRMDFFLDIFRAACAQPRPCLNPELSIQISANIHHYLDHTAKILESLTPDTFRSIWTGLVLEDEKAFAFVMNSLDATTSLHRAFLLPEDPQRHIEIAYQSRAASIDDFCSTVSEITPPNATATLTFAALQVILCLEFPISLNDPNFSSIIDGAYELFISIRGFYHLQPAACPHITDPVLSAWMRSSPPSPASIPANPEILHSISHLYHISKGLDISDDPRERSLCYIALAQLYTFFAETVLEPLTWPVLFTWPIIISEEFLELIKNRSPLALVILSHWFVPVFGNSRHWMLHGWAKQIVDGVAGSVDPGWHIAIGSLLELETVDLENLDVVVAGVELEGWTEAQSVQIPYPCRHPLLEGYLRSTTAEDIQGDQ